MDWLHQADKCTCAKGLLSLQQRCSRRKAQPTVHRGKAQPNRQPRSPSSAQHQVSPSLDDFWIGFPCFQTKNNLTKIITRKKENYRKHTSISHEFWNRKQMCWTLLWNKARLLSSLPQTTFFLSVKHHHSPGENSKGTHFHSKDIPGKTCLHVDITCVLLSTDVWVAETHAG